MSCSRLSRPLMLLLLTTACGVELTDLTPNPFCEQATGQYEIALEVKKATAVFNNSISAFVTIDGVQQPMSGSGIGTWTYVQGTPSPSDLDVSFAVSFRYSYALFFTRSGSERLPESGASTVAIRPPAAVSVSPDQTTIAVGGTVQLSETVRDNAGDELRPCLVDWSSSDPAVASVDNASGLVTGVTPGSATILATVGGVTASASVTVTASPPPPGGGVTPMVIRSGAQDVQTFDFSDPASPQLIDTEPVTGAPGTLAVGLAPTGLGFVVRSASQEVNGIEAFAVANTGALTAAGSENASFSGTGVAVAVSGTTVIRASSDGIQSFSVDAQGNLQARQSLTGGQNVLSSTGVGVDLSPTGDRAVRATSHGIEVYDVANPNAMTRLGGSGLAGALSTAGTGVAIFANGARAVRAYDGGLELWDISNPSVIQRLANTMGDLSGTGVAVAVNAARAVAIRTTDDAIEIYDLSNLPDLTLLGSLNVNEGSGMQLSITGVGIALVGTLAFRGTHDRVEAFDVSNPGQIVFRGGVDATQSGTGVGLVAR